MNSPTESHEEKGGHERDIVLALELNNLGKSFASADHKGRVCSDDVMGCIMLSGERVPGAFIREHPLDAWQLTSVG